LISPIQLDDDGRIPAAACGIVRDAPMVNERFAWLRIAPMPSLLTIQLNRRRIVIVGSLACHIQYSTRRMLGR